MINMAAKHLRSIKSVLAYKIHGHKEGNIAMCGHHVGRHSTNFGMLDEITCKSCLKIIKKKFDLKGD